MSCLSDVHWCWSVIIAVNVALVVFFRSCWSSCCCSLSRRWEWSAHESFIMKWSFIFSLKRQQQKETLLLVLHSFFTWLLEESSFKTMMMMIAFVGWIVDTALRLPLTVVFPFHHHVQGSTVRRRESPIGTQGIRSPVYTVYRISVSYLLGGPFYPQKQQLSRINRPSFAFKKTRLDTFICIQNDSKTL